MVGGVNQVRSIVPMPALPAADAASIGTAGVSRVHRARSMKEGPGPLQFDEHEKVRRNGSGYFRYCSKHWHLQDADCLQAALAGQVHFLADVLSSRDV